MFVYIDLRSANLLDGKFAIYDETNKQFIIIDGRQVFESLEDLHSAIESFSEKIDNNIIKLILNNY